ncbi:MAG: L-threonylcarbamoyladenylate synthase [bacterium]
MPILAKSVEECRDYLERGWVLAYPTDTTYGLGVNPFNKDAVDYLDSIKKRSLHKNYLMLVKSVDMLSVYAELSEEVRDFINMASPKAVSVILKAKKKLAEWLIDKDGNAGFRIAKGEFVKKLFEYYDRPLISTSANPEGYPIAKDAEEVFAYFQNYERIAVAQDVYQDVKGVTPSTVIDFTKTPPVVVRQGSFRVVF